MSDMILGRVPIPVRLGGRPRDHRGFIVPFFVQWMKDGAAVDEQESGAVPDFRVVDHRRMINCVNKKRCFLCGQPMGIHLGFVLGPMCTINRVISEPPSHRECSEYALRVCPFLTQPRMRRNNKDLPTDYVEAAGLPAARNPGVMALWMARSYKPITAYHGNAGTLFQVGPFERVDWWTQGRKATHDEAAEAIKDGYRLLLETAKDEGPDAVKELEKMTMLAMLTLPP